MNKKISNNISDENEINIKELEIKKANENSITVFGIIDIIVFLIINTVVCLGWQGLELLLVGEIRPNDVDSVIGLILTFSLFGNYRQYIKKHLMK